jgi:hypothetical protein
MNAELVAGVQDRGHRLLPFPAEQVVEVAARIQEERRDDTRDLRKASHLDRRRQADVHVMPPDTLWGLREQP